MRGTHRHAVLAAAAWLAALVATGSTGVQAQQDPTAEPRIWQGVYAAAQAERGKALFNNSCIRCHGGDLAGVTAPALKGERFQTTWGGEMLDRLFGKIRDTMPPNFGTTLDDQSKLDIVTYILQTNGYPAGSAELALASNDLTSAQILMKGQQASVQNFSLVHTVGCLTRGPNDTWTLTRTAEPLATREDAPTAEGLAAAAARPLGTRTFRLLSAGVLRPDSNLGQKVEARGLIYRAAGDERLTLTSLQRAGSVCSE